MRAAAQGGVSHTSPEENASETGAEKHLEPELRFEEGPEGLASSATARSQRRGIGMTQSTELRKWREGKVRPIPGNPPHDRLVSRVISSSLKKSLRRSLPRHRFPHLQNNTGRPVCVFKASRNLSGPMWFQNQNQKPNPGVGPCRPPLVGPEPR